jgi:hypothetical protein
MLLSEANRRAAILRSISGVMMESLEKRILLSLPDPIVPIQLPSAPLPLQGVVGTPLSLDPQLIDNSYGFNSVAYKSGSSIVPGDGTGETIAIVDPFGSPTLVNDVETFDQHWRVSNDDGENNFFLTVQPLDKGTTTATSTGVTNPDWAEETTLDVEWAHAVAPGAHILLVLAPSAGMLDLMDSVVFAEEQKGVVAVSMSWGAPEFSQDLLFDGFMATPTGHLDNDGLPGGVTFVVASGDNSALDYPADSIDALSVGGTTLSTDINGQVVTQGAWALSGGGQTNNYFDLLGGNKLYNTPLVALDADPATGVWIYDSTENSSQQSGWQVVGGTSFSAPAWAGFMAIIDQGLNLKGLPSLDSQSAINDLEFLGETTPNDFFTLYQNPPTTYPLYGNSPTSPIPDNSKVPVNGNTGFGSPIPISGAFDFGLQPVEGDPIQYGAGLVPDLVDQLVPLVDAQKLASQATEPLDFFPQTGTIADAPVVTDANSVDSFVFTTQPSSVTAGQDIAPDVSLQVNRAGQTAVDANYNGPVTVTISSLSPSGTTTLLGTTTVTANNGVVNFSDLQIDQAGTYVLQATGPDAFTAQSETFTVIAGVATGSLTVSQQPSNAWQFTALPGAVQFAVEDAFGNPVAINGNTVTLKVLSGPAGTVLGPTTATMTNGTATFSGLSFTTPGTYVLQASGSGLGTTATDSFTVVAIPIMHHFLLNGSVLGPTLLALQQKRNAPIVSANGAPTDADIESAIAADVSAAEAESNALVRAASPFVAGATVAPVANNTSLAIQGVAFSAAGPDSTSIDGLFSDDVIADTNTLHHRGLRALIDGH